ncbi:MAG: CHAT domain-containing protein, partial [bacterium]|nr:CHAT domain-containing protein [bacterium]
EVLGLNLQGTELVSLSACETGKGVIDYSEGVYGLIRAFRTAGAKHVLMTLSSVGDKAAKEFMVTFYDFWLSSGEGRSPADALHETRLYFIEHENPAYRDPEFWSPYVMVGP